MEAERRILSLISIHAPRGGSDLCVADHERPRVYFNPRSPWGERLIHLQGHGHGSQFQSTLPVGGATSDMS